MSTIGSKPGICLSVGWVRGFCLFFVRKTDALQSASGGQERLQALSAMENFSSPFTSVQTVPTSQIRGTVLASSQIAPAGPAKWQHARTQNTQPYVSATCIAATLAITPHPFQPCDTHAHAHPSSTQRTPALTSKRASARRNSRSGSLRTWPKSM